MIDLEGMNDVRDLTDIPEELERLSDMVGDTRITGFEQIGDLGNDSVARFLQENIPEEHLRDCPEIRYAPESDFFKQYPWAAGVFYTDTNLIEIASEKAFATVSDMMDTVTHEVGHNAFEQLEMVDPQASKRWAELYSESMNLNGTGFGFVSEYAKTNLFEDFAESYRTYINDPELLRFMSPGKYEFMKNLVFLGREYGTLSMVSGEAFAMERGVADVLIEALENDGGADEDLIEISDVTPPVADTFRCFSMVA